MARCRDNISCSLADSLLGSGADAYPNNADADGKDGSEDSEVARARRARDEGGEGCCFREDGTRSGMIVGFLCTMECILIDRSMLEYAMISIRSIEYGI